MELLLDVLTTFDPDFPIVSLITPSTPQILFVNTTSKPDSSTTDLALYQTDIVFDETSNYTFPIKKLGGHSIHLYFYTFNHKSRNLSKIRKIGSCKQPQVAFGSWCKLTDDVLDIKAKDLWGLHGFDDVYHVVFDMTLNTNDGLLVTSLLRSAVSSNIICRKLIVLVKDFVKVHKINDPREGTLKSICYCILYTAFLQKVGLLPLMDTSKSKELADR
ncbi:hypothetical protein POM88_037326 [Heracleum sosnowskyi]|uniref:Uncharacterized protein n=1 Tax=Heracleum sosnowskyi TaxID=360622 RepID=A0AAD8HRD1_9APIA|nr:hypothetical protein POM88_037326 [Heracleum sosnowskyi]